MVTGPVRLLHANFDRKKHVRFYRVWQRPGEERICQNGAPLAWDGESELQIQKDELVCVSGARKSAISWHARSVVGDASQTPGRSPIAIGTPGKATH